MHPSLILTIVALPLLSFAAPSPQRGPRRRPGFPPRPRQDVSCDLSETEQPPNALTPPTPDLSLVLIALGRGTQNYSCATAASAPAAIGAVADLFNASCAAAGNSFGAIEEDAATIGAHFFVDNTTPEFDIIGLGNTLTKKVENVTAPDPAANVPWLKLQAQEAGTTSAVKQIYRLNTVGGLAPSSCEGRADGEVVAVNYEAEYWIYALAETVEKLRKKRALNMGH